MGGTLSLFPFPVIVTNRIIRWVVGDSYKPVVGSVAGKGDKSPDTF